MLSCCGQGENRPGTGENQRNVLQNDFLPLQSRFYPLRNHFFLLQRYFVPLQNVFHLLRCGFAPLQGLFFLFRRVICPVRQGFLRLRRRLEFFQPVVIKAIYSKGLISSISQCPKSRILRVAKAKLLLRATAAIWPSGRLMGRPFSLRRPIISA